MWHSKLKISAGPKNTKKSQQNNLCEITVACCWSASKVTRQLLNQHQQICLLPPSSLPVPPSSPAILTHPLHIPPWELQHLSCWVLNSATHTISSPPSFHAWLWSTTSPLAPVNDRMNFKILLLTFMALYSRAVSRSFVSRIGIGDPNTGHALRLPNKALFNLNKKPARRMKT